MDLSSVLVDSLDLRNPVLGDKAQSFRVTFESSDSHEEIDGEVDTGVEVLLSSTQVGP